MEDCQALIRLMATDLSSESDRVEQKIVELRSSIDQAKAAFNQRVALLRAELDEEVESARNELIACHEKAAKLLRQEAGEEPSNDGAASVSIAIGRLALPANATIRDWAQEVFRLSGNRSKGMHFAQVADWAMRLGYGGPNCDIAVAHTSFRRTMHTHDDVFRRLGDGYYRLAQDPDSEQEE